MFALISPEEFIRSHGSKTEHSIVLGQRIAEVSANEFPVAPPLFWVACENDVMASQYYYDSNLQQIVKIPDVIEKSI
jgi:hypothetical protein